MKNMSQASETQFEQAPPDGTYLTNIKNAVATIAKSSGSTMIEVELVIADPAYLGYEPKKDYLITDGQKKGAGIAKRKLRGIGGPLIERVLDTDEEVPDAALAQSLIGQTLFVTYDSELVLLLENKDDPTSPRTKTLMVDGPNGVQEPMRRLTAKAYSRSAPQQAGATPIQQVAPQQAAPQQFAQPTTQFAGATGFNHGQAFNPGTAQPAWSGAAQAAPAPAPAKGKGKKVLVDDGSGAPQQVQNGAAPAQSGPPGWSKDANGNWVQIAG